MARGAAGRFYSGLLVYVRTCVLVLVLCRSQSHGAKACRNVTAQPHPTSSLLPVEAFSALLGWIRLMADAGCGGAIVDFS